MDEKKALLDVALEAYRKMQEAYENWKAAVALPEPLPMPEKPKKPDMIHDALEWWKYLSDKKLWEEEKANRDDAGWARTSAIGDAREALFKVIPESGIWFVMPDGWKVYRAIGATQLQYNSDLLIYAPGQEEGFSPNFIKQEDESSPNSIKYVHHAKPDDPIPQLKESEVDDLPF